MTTVKFDFGTGFDVSESPADEFNIDLDMTEGFPKLFAVATGGDSYAITLPATVGFAYAAGQMFVFQADVGNTGACTLNVNGAGAKAIKKRGDQDTATGDIEANQIVVVVYDGTNMQMISEAAAARLIDADADTSVDVEATADIDLVRVGVPATSATFMDFLKGAEAVKRLTIKDDGLYMSDGTAAIDTWLRRTGTRIWGIWSGTTGNALEFYTMAAPTVPGGNNLSLYTKVVGTSPFAFFRNSAGVDFGPIGQKEQATIYGRGPAGGLECPMGATWSDGLWGVLAPAGSWTPAGTPSVQDDTTVLYGRNMLFTSGIVSGDDAGIESAARYWANKGDSLLIRVRLPTTTSVRMFAGAAAQTLATCVGADDPGTNVWGLQYSTPRGDTTWKLTERSTGAQTVTNTSISVHTEPIYIQFHTGTFSAMIVYDKNFVPVYTRSINVFATPGTTTKWSIVAGVETQTGAARTLEIYHAELHTRTG